MAYHLGVDLGTTFTAAALWRDGRAEPVTLGSTSVAVPSVAYLADNGEVVFGQPAVRRATTEPSRVAREFKRRVGDPTPLVLGGTPIPAEMLMARLLDWVVTQVSATEGDTPASLAVTHPANWGHYKLDLLGQAVRHLGLQIDQLVPEPVAAASFYASQRDLEPGSVVAVYDLGGGTFDAALVRAEPTGFSIVGQPDGIERLGGIDFDHAVLAHVATSIDINLELADQSDSAQVAALGQLRHECNEAKEALSSETDVAIPVMLPNRHTEVRLTRGELEAMIRPTLDETLVALRRTISSAELTPEDITAVLLVGGSSRIPLVGQLVAAELHRPIAVDARPKDAIPLGAAITAANASTERSEPTAVVAATPALAAPQPVTGPPTPLTPPPALQPVAAGGRSKAAWWAAAVVLLGGGALAYILTSGGDGDGTETANRQESDATEPPPTDPPLGGGDDGYDLGGLAEELEGLGELEDLLGGAVVDQTDERADPAEPLPGSTWNDEAEAQFVAECANGEMGALAPQLGTTAEGYCGCLYDELASSGTGFDDFNAQWSGDAAVDQSLLWDASVSCIGSSS